MKNHSKHALRPLLIAAAAAALLCVSALAAETGIITEKVVNARSGPGTQYDRVELLAAGKQVTVLGEENGWYHVAWNNSKGYVSKEYVSTGSDAPASDTDAAITGGSTINVRSGPGTGYSRVGQVGSGKRVKVLGKDGDWYKISYDGKTGYVLTDYLLPDGSSAPVKATAPAAAPAEDHSNASVTGGSTINVRTGAGTGYSRVTRVSAGKRVEILGQENGWYQVRFDGKTGYISGEYVHPDDPSMAIVQPAPAEPEPVEVPAEPEPAVESVPEAAPEAAEPEAEVTITAAESQTLGAAPTLAPDQGSGDAVIVGGTINVRTGPGTEFDRISKLTTGKRVTILDQSGEWYHIAFDGGEGYVLGQYVHEGDLPAASGVAAQVVELALQYQGVRYVYGGSSPSGFDCSGFTSYLYRQFGYSLPHTASGQYANCGYKVSRSELQPGDLVFFTSSGNGGRINHVGVYIGGDRVIHARYSIGKVYINSLSETYYNRNYVGAVRIA